MIFSPHLFIFLYLQDWGCLMRTFLGDIWKKYRKQWQRFRLCITGYWMWFIHWASWRKAGRSSIARCKNKYYCWLMSLFYEKSLRSSKDKPTKFCGSSGKFSSGWFSIYILGLLIFWKGYTWIYACAWLLTYANSSK